MTSLVNVTAKALTVACDVIGALDAVNKMRCARERFGNAEDYEGVAWLERASVINRLVLLGISSVEIGMIINGSKAQSLRVLKGVEVLPRAVQMPLQFVSEIISTPPNEPIAKAGMRILSKGIVGPLADVVRTSFEQSIYEEQNYLDRLAEDPKATRPIYERVGSGDSEYLIQIGERPIDPQECKTTIDQAKNAAGVAAVVRVVAEAPIEDSVISTYELLAQFMQRAIGIFHRDPQAPDHPQGGEHIDFTNLMALDTIPDPLENDVVFRRYICPITRRPIRHPVRDPNGITLYERSVIEAYLGDDVRPSPVTRRPMSRRDLQEVPGIQAIIDARLRQHQQQFEQYVRESSQSQ